MADCYTQPQVSSPSNPNYYGPRAEPQRRSSTLGTRHYPKLTGYRLLVIVLTAGFGLSKAKLSYNGQSTAPNTLDWLYGVIAFLLLYWLGIYEKYSAHNMPLMFEKDYLALVWKVVSTLWGLVVLGTGSNPSRQIPSRRSTRQD